MRIPHSFPSSSNISEGCCKIMASPLSLTNQWPVLPEQACLLNSNTVLVHELSYICMLAKWETSVIREKETTKGIISHHYGFFLWSVHQSSSSPAARFNMLCHLICLKGSRPALLTYRLHHDWRGPFSAMRGRGPSLVLTIQDWAKQSEQQDGWRKRRWRTRRRRKRRRRRDGDCTSPLWLTHMRGLGLLYGVLAPWTPPLPRSMSLRLLGDIQWCVRGRGAGGLFPSPPPNCTHTQILSLTCSTLLHVSADCKPLFATWQSPGAECRNVVEHKHQRPFQL